MKYLITLVVLFLTACGSSPDKNLRADDEPVAPPEPGETRDGLAYRVAIPASDPSFDIVFQVLEPQTMVGGETYPIIIHSHGFGNARGKDHNYDTDVGNLKHITANGYGAISVDMRGHGETGGLIRVQDPDFEIQDVMNVLDWIDDNLDWVTRAFDEDAGEVNVVMGSVGASYGGQFQLLTHALDPKKRLDAMVPSNTWHDLTYALVTNGVLKSGWIKLLFGAGNNAGDNSKGNFDPYVSGILAQAELANEMPADGLEFLRYHSFDYFCDGVPVATNGGEGTSPQQAATAPSAIPTLFSQGLRDTLFNLRDAFSNYNCMRDVGANDVRLITYQSGHNTLFPGIGVTNQNPVPAAADRNCAALTLDDAVIAFFDEHLKGVTGEADRVIGDGNEVCLSLDVNNAIRVDRTELEEGGSLFGGTEFAFSDALVIAAASTTSTATVVADTVYTAPAEGAVVAGFPQARLSISTSVLGAATNGEAIIMVGIGHKRAGGDGTWDLVDNQVTPIRGNGDYEFELAAVAEKLNAGDQLAILLYASYQTHATSFTRDPQAVNMHVSGSVFVPIAPADTVILSK